MTLKRKSVTVLIEQRLGQNPLDHRDISSTKE
jgi:hypothetical protein